MFRAGRREKHITNPEAGDIPREISWTCHPARARPVAAVLVGLFLIGLTVAIQLSWKEWYITAIAGSILCLSVAPFYLPTRYEMDDRRIRIRTVRSRKEKPWSRFRRAAADRHGAILSPFDHRSRLDRFHGLNIRYDEKDRARVLEFIGARVKLDVADE